jgi:DNA-binding transcriptional ArsR family regulator
MILLDSIKLYNRRNGQMANWEDAPVTRAAFGAPEGKGPPAISREWQELCKEDQDTVFLWAGEWNRQADHLGWVWMWRSTGKKSEGKVLATRTPAASVERMLSPLAHEARIRIMQTLHDGPKASGELAEATGLRGGNLYYHLKELVHAAYVAERKGSYDLTGLGCQMLLTVTAIAANVVKDRGEEGLVVGDSSGE